MLNFLKNVSAEKRKIRWSSHSKTLRVFFSTLITLLIFIIIIGLFSWGMGAIIALS